MANHYLVGGCSVASGKQRSALRKNGHEGLVLGREPLSRDYRCGAGTE